MALGFFRRRQKMVIIIMVVLMVSFLVGFAGFSMLLQPNPNKAELADTRLGPVTRGELLMSSADTDILGALGFCNNLYRAQQWPKEIAYIQFTRGAANGPAMPFALLLKEAQASGGIVVTEEVDEFFRALGYADPSTYKSVVSSLRSSRSWTERAIRQAVSNWLRIYKAYTLATVKNCPPSETELQVTYRDVKEEIDLRVVRLKAADFVKDVPNPKPDVIQKQFDTYRPVYPGQSHQPLDMGFGYRQLGRAQAQYLLARGEVVGRVAEPSFDELVDYYHHNKSEFYKEVPVNLETAPADAPVPTVRVPLSFAEAKQQVIEHLSESTVSGRMDELVGLVQKSLTRNLAAGVDPNKVYAKIVDELTGPADAMLAKPLTGLKIENLPLDRAIKRLAGAAEISGICFPWGTHGAQTLLPSVKVTLTGDMTVRGALDDICRQVKFPRLEWATCLGFANVLFSVERVGQGMDFFPIKAAQTGLWTRRQFSEDPVLGFCVANPSGQGESFAQAIFSAKGLNSGPGATAMVELGGQGLRMYMLGDSPGQLLWRLIGVAPAHEPHIMTPEIRRQVVSDLKLAAAMKLAAKTAETIRDAAKIIGLATAAERKKVDAFTTGLFPRRMLNMSWSAVPKLDELDTQALLAYFTPRAFELMPEDLDANAASQPKAVGVVGIPAKAEVLVLERNDYHPVLKHEYEDTWRLEVARFLNIQRNVGMMGAWFNDKNIRIRMGFKRR